MRYEALIERVRLKQPRSILEVGTWNGSRALEMLRACPRASYYGFDLFECATPETDAAEMNVKPHSSIDDVRRKLDGFKAYLFRGNTRETLPRFAKIHDGEIEFVWLDGGHSVDTIRSDWNAIAPLLATNAEVWFDDYYTGGPDITRMGCNAVVKDLAHELHPERDLVKGGGFVQMVRVYPALSLTREQRRDYATFE